MKRAGPAPAPIVNVFYNAGSPVLNGRITIGYFDDEVSITNFNITVTNYECKITVNFTRGDVVFKLNYYTESINNYVENGTVRLVVSAATTNDNLSPYLIGGVMSLKQATIDNEGSSLAGSADSYSTLIPRPAPNEWNFRTEGTTTTGLIVSYSLIDDPDYGYYLSSVYTNFVLVGSMSGTEIFLGTLSAFIPFNTIT